MTSVADVLHDSGDRLQIASSIGINLNRSLVSAGSFSFERSR
jgi:hypothetical protein